MFSFFKAEVLPDFDLQYKLLSAQEDCMMSGDFWIIIGKSLCEFEPHWKVYKQKGIQRNKMALCAFQCSYTISTRYTVHILKA